MRIIILAPLFISLNIFSQKIITHKSNVIDSEFNISEFTEIKRQEIDGEVIETFIVFSELSEFQFSLTLSKMSSDNIEFDELKEGEFKESYLENCNCIVKEENEVVYNKFKSYQFSTIINYNEQNLYGLIDNIIYKKNAYAFIYITTIDNFKRFKTDYTTILNSIKFMN